MHRRSAVTMGLLFAALGVLGLSDEAAGQASRMVVLTDGTSMNNFDAVGDANWRIAERTIAAYKGNGFLVTKQPYGDFRIRAEFWVDEDANSGIFIRCDEGARPSGATCYEVNIFENSPNRATAPERSSMSPKWSRCRKPPTSGTSSRSKPRAPN